MYVTYPLAVTDTEIWLLIDHSDLGSIEALRLGLDPSTGDYVAFPPEQFHTDGVMPVCRTHGEPVAGFIWAEVSDLERNPAFPGHHETDLP